MSAIRLVSFMIPSDLVEESTAACEARGVTVDQLAVEAFAAAIAAATVVDFDDPSI